MKKICFLVEYLTYIGGGERVYTNLANTFIKNGYEVTILSIESGEKTYYPLDKNIKIKSLKIRKEKYYNEKNRKVKDAIYTLHIKRSIEKELKECSYNAVISIGCNMNLILSLIKVKDILKIGTEHTGYNSVNLILKIARKILYKSLDKLIILTEIDKNNYKKFLHQSKIEIIPNQLTFYPPVCAELKNKKIVNVGSLSYSKNQEKLLELFKRFSEISKEWTLDIYGSGKLKIELENKIKDLGLENKVFLKGNTEKIKEVLLDASIFCLTSRYEGFPMVLLEAMACGLPCVAFDCPTGPKEIVINNKTGFLVGVGDDKTYLEKMIILSENIDLRLKMGQESRKKSLYYSEEEVFKQWKKILD